MTTLTRNKALLTGAIFILLFFPSFYFIPKPFFGEIINGLLFALGVGTIVAYAPSLIQALQSDKPSNAQFLLLGIGISWVAVSARGLMSLFWRVNNMPISFPDGAVWTGTVWFSLIAAVLHITAPGTFEGTIPKRNLFILGVCTSIGLLTVMLAIWLRVIG